MEKVKENMNRLSLPFSLYGEKSRALWLLLPDKQELMGSISPVH